MSTWSSHHHARSRRTETPVAAPSRSPGGSSTPGRRSIVVSTVTSWPCDARRSITSRHEQLVAAEMVRRVEVRDREDADHGVRERTVACRARRRAARGVERVVVRRRSARLGRGVDAPARAVPASVSSRRWRRRTCRATASRSWSSTTAPTTANATGTWADARRASSTGRRCGAAPFATSTSGGPAAGRNRGGGDRAGPGARVHRRRLPAPARLARARCSPRSTAAPTSCRAARSPTPRRAHGAGPWDRSIAVDGPTPFFETCNIAYRRTWFDKLGGFDEHDALTAPGAGRHFGEDAVLGARLVVAGGVAAYCDDAVVHHRWLPGTFREHLAHRRRVVGLPRAARGGARCSTRRSTSACSSRGRPPSSMRRSPGAVLAATTRRRWPLLLAAPWLARRWRDAAAKRDGRAGSGGARGARAGRSRRAGVVGRGQRSAPPARALTTASSGNGGSTLPAAMADDDLETSLRWSSDPDAADDDDIADGARRRARVHGRPRRPQGATRRGRRAAKRSTRSEPRLAKLVADLDDLVQQARRAALDRRDLTAEMRDGLGELRDALRRARGRRRRGDGGRAGRAARRARCRCDGACRCAARQRRSATSRSTTLADAVADRLVERLGLGDGVMSVLRRWLPKLRDRSRRTRVMWALGGVAAIVGVIGSSRSSACASVAGDLRGARDLIDEAVGRAGGRADRGGPPGARSCAGAAHRRQRRAATRASSSSCSAACRSSIATSTR